MASLAEVRAAHPVEDRDAYDKAYAEADLAGRIAEMAYGMRVAAGLSQTELAKRMGTSQPAIARLENAGSVPGIEFLARLAVSTGVDLSLTATGVAEVNFAPPAAALPVKRMTRDAPATSAPAKAAAKKTPAKKSSAKKAAAARRAKIKA